MNFWMRLKFAWHAVIAIVFRRDSVMVRVALDEKGTLHPMDGRFFLIGCQGFNPAPPAAPATPPSESAPAPEVVH